MFTSSESLRVSIVLDTSEDNFLSEKGFPGKEEEEKEEDGPSWSNEEIVERYHELIGRNDEWDGVDDCGFVRVVVSREQFYQETSGQPVNARYAQKKKAEYDDDDDEDDDDDDPEEVEEENVSISLFPSS